jgi:hypothetical protein
MVRVRSAGLRGFLLVITMIALLPTDASRDGATPAGALLNRLKKEEKGGLKFDVQTDAHGNLRRAVWMEADAIRRYEKISKVNLFDTTYSVCFVREGVTREGEKVQHELKLHVLVAINEHGNTEPVAWGITRRERTEDYHHFFSFVKNTTGGLQPEVSLNPFNSIYNHLI